MQLLLLHAPGCRKTVGQPVVGRGAGSSFGGRVAHSAAATLHLLAIEGPVLRNSRNLRQQSATRHTSHGLSDIAAQQQQTCRVAGFGFCASSSAAAAAACCCC